MLRARTNCVGKFIRLGGGHHKNHAVGRLFQSFQKRVGRFVGEHVRFVEDDDLVMSAGGGVAHHVAQFADLIDAAIRGGVNFNHVHGISGGNFAAGITFVAGSGRWTFDAVQSLRENSRGGGFSNSARAGKNVGVRDAIGANRIFKRGHHMALADDIRKSLRTPFSRDDLIACFRVGLRFAMNFVRAQKQKTMRGTSGTPRHTA